MYDIPIPAAILNPNGNHLFKRKTKETRKALPKALPHLVKDLPILLKRSSRSISSFLTFLSGVVFSDISYKLAG